MHNIRNISFTHTGRGSPGRGRGGQLPGVKSKIFEGRVKSAEVGSQTQATTPLAGGQISVVTAEIDAQSQVTNPTALLAEQSQDEKRSASTENAGSAMSRRWLRAVKTLDSTSKNKDTNRDKARCMYIIKNTPIDPIHGYCKCNSHADT